MAECICRASWDDDSGTRQDKIAANFQVSITVPRRSMQRGTAWHYFVTQKMLQISSFQVASRFPINVWPVGLNKCRQMSLELPPNLYCQLSFENWNLFLGFSSRAQFVGLDLGSGGRKIWISWLAITRTTATTTTPTATITATTNTRQHKTDK